MARSLSVVSALVWLAACGDDSSAVVGSGNVVERVTPIMIVEEVKISVPFAATVRDGAPEQVVLRGEDNLLDEIVVEEVEIGKVEISAPENLNFEQTKSMEIEVPFIDMVRISTHGGEIDFADQPGSHQEE